MAEEQPSVKAAEEKVVPPDLMRQLHEADDRFRAAKIELEKLVASSEDDQQRKQDQAAERLRAAERDIEAITGKIHGCLQPPPAVTDRQA